MRIPRRLFKPGLGLGLFILFAVSASAQGFRIDQLWLGPADLAGTFQGTRELSGRAEITSFLTPANPRDLHSVCDERKAAEQAALEFNQEHYDALQQQAPSARNANDFIWTAYALAQVHAYSGEMAETTKLLQTARDTLAGLGSRSQFPGSVAGFDGLIGVSELRRGELENCVMHPNASRCIFPVTGTGEHEMKSGAEGAFAALTRALAASPDDLELKWLLNVTAMTLGKYPGGVPKAALIPAERFASDEDVGRFVNVAPELGLDRVGRAGGAVIDDFNGDGRLDLVESSIDPCEPLRLFLQQPDGHFREATHAGLDDQLGGINAVQTDYNNDGHLDLFVMRGGWEVPIRNSLLRNNGDGTFTDVTAEAGLMDVPHSTHSAAWADYDNDGWLDLFVGHERSISRLYHNRGDGTFEDVTRKAGVEFSGLVKGVAWGDYDRDGYPDLYLSNFGEPNVLYHNNGNGTFSVVTSKMGVAEPRMSFATWFFDYDNDGWPDLFVADFVPSVVETVKSYVGQRSAAETMKLYRNIGGMRFEDVTARVGLDRVTMAMGANFGDIDNDGWLDFYLGTGAPSFAGLVPNLLFRNHNGERFVDITTSSGTGHLQKGHGVAIGDLDGDGNEDIFVNIGGFVPADAYEKVLFRNPGHHGHWIDLTLTGVKTNRAAIGVPLTIFAVGASGRERAIPRVVSSGGSYGASPLTVHVGLADATAVSRIEVYWPASRTTQTITDVPLDRRTHITEPWPGSDTH